MSEQRSLESEWKSLSEDEQTVIAGALVLGAEGFPMALSQILACLAPDGMPEKKIVATLEMLTRKNVVDKEGEESDRYKLQQWVWKTGGVKWVLEAINGLDTSLLDTIFPPSNDIP